MDLQGLGLDLPGLALPVVDPLVLLDLAPDPGLPGIAGIDAEIVELAVRSRASLGEE